MNLTRNGGHWLMFLVASAAHLLRGSGYGILWQKDLQNF